MKTILIILSLCLAFSIAALVKISISNALLRSQLAALQAQNRMIQDESNKNQLSKDDQDVRDAVAGVYSFDVPYTGDIRVLDFRSDGTAQYCRYMDGNESVPFDKKNLTWSFAENRIYLSGQNGNFRPEGEDLIDAGGNRWKRER